LEVLYERKKYDYMVKKLLVCFSLIILGVAVGSVSLEQLYPGRFVWQGIMGDSKNFAFWLKSFGPWAIIISIFVMVIQTIATPLPLFLVAGANGFIFGAAWGIIITMAGALLGSTLAFYLARFIARDYFAKHLVKYMPQVEEMSHESGVKVIFLARLIPVLPSSIISYAAGLSKVSFTGFFMASVFGKFPEIVIYTFLGHGLEKADGLMTKITILLLVVSVLYFSLESKSISSLFMDKSDKKPKE
jgi:uncharacterized membrane protein YdjX (TVP38/TMEM64 family)